MKWQQGKTGQSMFLPFVTLLVLFVWSKRYVETMIGMVMMGCLGDFWKPPGYFQWAPLFENHRLHLYILVSCENQSTHHSNKGAAYKVSWLFQQLCASWKGLLLLVACPLPQPSRPSADRLIVIMITFMLAQILAWGEFGYIATAFSLLPILPLVHYVRRTLQLGWNSWNPSWAWSFDVFLPPKSDTWLSCVPCRLTQRHPRQMDNLL